jgi:PST family polysaccharide transporter
MSNARAQASRSLLWSAVDTFSQTGFSIVALVLLARLLSVEAIGIGSLTIMLVQLATMPFELLFHDAVIQRKELQARHHSTAFIAAVVGATCGAVLLFIAAPWLAAQYAKPQLTALIRVACLALPISAVSSIISALLRRNLAFAPLARRTVIGRLVGVGLGLMVAALGGGAWALVVMYVASIVLSTAVLLSDRSNWPGMHWSFSALRELLAFGAPNMLAQVLLLGNGRIFVVIAGFYLGDAGLGRLSLAFRLVEELRNTLSSAAAQLALPLLSKRAHQPQQFALVFSEATSFTACILLPLYAGMAVTAPDLMAVVFGDKWQVAAPAVQWLALAAIVITLRQYSSIAMNAVGRPGMNALINALAFAFSLVLLITGWVSSAETAAQVWAWRAVLLLVISIIATRTTVLLSVRAQLAPVVAPLLASGAMYLGVVLANHTLPDVYAGAPRLIMNIALGICLYVLALLAVSRQLVKRLAGFTRAALLRHSYVAE